MRLSPPGIILATLNAKYIHASLGLRYVLANMARYGGEELRARTVVREFALTRTPQDVADALLMELGVSTTPQIIGFGVYIWNVTATTEVVRLLKTARADAIIVLGGPEVSYEWANQEIVSLADYLITGWGEVSFPKLCRALLRAAPPAMKVIEGEQAPLDEIEFPYKEYGDADLAHRVVYVEASRGCPFKCEFCLSSLDKTSKAFAVERFLAEMNDLYRRGARKFKFVDRTFNLKIEITVRILHFFLERLDDDLFLHFELIPDRLPSSLKQTIARFPPGVLQFEVGIQSFNPDVQQRISRRQDNEASVANLRWLSMQSQAHLHADLVFGLPGESWESFATGFDRLYALGPHEIQLGILKRLRGAPIARHIEGFRMVFDPSPPYSLLQNCDIDAETVRRFARLARYWDLLANSGRFKRSMDLLLQGDTPFGAFAQCADWLWRRCAKTQGLTPEFLVDALFDYLCNERALPVERVRQSLLDDYLDSGARANPQCLRGLLAQRPPPMVRSSISLTRRQARYG